MGINREKRASLNHNSLLNQVFSGNKEHQSHSRIWRITRSSNRLQHSGKLNQGLSEKISSSDKNFHNSRQHFRI